MSPPAHLDPRVSVKLIRCTERLLGAMSKLTKPAAGDGDDCRSALESQCSKVEKRWKHVQRAARQILGNGSAVGISYYEWRSAVWRSSSFRHYDNVRGYWAQQRESYKRWKKFYDKRRRRLIKAGVWERARATKEFQKVHALLIEAIDLDAPQEVIDAIRGRFVNAHFSMRRVGPYCQRCNDVRCEHCRHLARGLDPWLMEIWRRSRNREGEVA